MTEYFDVINEKDEVVGKATREECHKKGLLHRAVHIILVSKKGQILLQKRSMKKDLYKGWWIDAAAGHVDSGESCEQAASREVKEELGLNVGKDVKMEELFKLRKKAAGKDYIDNEMITVYLVKSDGPFTVPKDEVEFVRFFDPKEVLKMLKTEKFTPGTQAVFEGLMKRPEHLKRLGLS